MKRHAHLAWASNGPKSTNPRQEASDPGLSVRQPHISCVPTLEDHPGTQRQEEPAARATKEYAALASVRSPAPRASWICTVPGALYSETYSGGCRGLTSC